MNQRNILIGAAVVLGIIILLFLSRDPAPKVQQEAPHNTVEAAGNSDAQKKFEQAQKLEKENKLTEAKKSYQSILSEHPAYENMEQVQNKLGKLNVDLIFSNIPTDKTIMHEVKSGDTLGKLAKQYNTTVELIKRSNNLKSDVIRIGQKLRIWNGQFNIFVDKSQNILILKSGDEVLKVYNVSTGSNNSTPIGEFTITTKLIDPVWFNRGVVVPPESPANVLGSRWLGFDLPGYGIHGTVEPDKIGQQVTAGCVRMRNEEVEELYTMMPRGGKVVIVD